jgi:hypothetical protein
LRFSNQHFICFLLELSFNCISICKSPTCENYSHSIGFKLPYRLELPIMGRFFFLYHYKT